MTRAQQSVDRSDEPQFDMGDRIRKARRHRGQRITQGQLAAAITQAGWKVTSQAVGNWESGANDVNEDKRELVAIAVALRCGVSREWLLDRWDGTERRNGPTEPLDSRRNLPLKVVSWDAETELSAPIRSWFVREPISA
jgi:transcriptional regulator with XRE-family HTH domain